MYSSVPRRSAGDLVRPRVKQHVSHRLNSTHIERISPGQKQKISSLEAEHLCGARNLKRVN